MSIVLHHVHRFPRDRSPNRGEERLADDRQRLEHPALEDPLGSRVTISLLSAPDSAGLGHLKAWRGRVVDVDAVAIKIDVPEVPSQLGWDGRWAIVAIPRSRIAHVSCEMGAAL